MHSREGGIWVIKTKLGFQCTPFISYQYKTLPESLFHFPLPFTESSGTAGKLAKLRAFSKQKWQTPPQHRHTSSPKRSLIFRWCWPPMSTWEPRIVIFRWSDTSSRGETMVFIYFFLYITFLDLSSFLLVWFLVVLVVCLECEKVWVWERERRDFEIWVLVLMCFGEMGIAYLLELVSICEFLFLGFGYFLEILLLFVYVCIFVCMLMIIKINERNCLDVSHSASLDADAIGRFLCIVVRWWRLVQLIPNLGQFVCCVFV